MIQKTVTVFIYNKTGNDYRYLISEYKDKGWGFVSGRIQESESEFNTASRILKEQIGIVPVNLQRTDIVTNKSSADNNSIISSVLIYKVEDKDIIHKSDPSIVQLKWIDEYEVQMYLTKASDMDLLHKAVKHIKQGNESQLPL